MRRVLAQPVEIPAPRAGSGALAAHCGPFLVSSGWWLAAGPRGSGGADRAYYFLRSSDGTLEWIYHDRLAGRWYRQGWGGISGDPSPATVPQRRHPETVVRLYLRDAITYRRSPRISLTTDGPHIANGVPGRWGFQDNLSRASQEYLFAILHTHLPVVNDLRRHGLFIVKHKPSANWYSHLTEV